MIHGYRYSMIDSLFFVTFYGSLVRYLFVILFYHCYPRAAEGQHLYLSWPTCCYILRILSLNAYCKCFDSFPSCNQSDLLHPFPLAFPLAFPVLSLCRSQHGSPIAYLQESIPFSFSGTFVLCSSIACLDKSMAAKTVSHTSY